MIRYSSKVVRDEVASAQSTCLLDVPLTRRRVGSLIAIASPPRMSADHQRFRGAAVSAGQELQGAGLACCCCARVAGACGGNHDGSTCRLRMRPQPVGCLIQNVPQPCSGLRLLRCCRLQGRRATGPRADDDTGAGTQGIPYLLRSLRELYGGEERSASLPRPHYQSASGRHL
jgi:hypothetical protein